MRPALWFKLGLREWPGYVPLVPTLRAYEKEDFSHDLVAGLVVGMVTIPQAGAYAFLAGVPPEAGLYACLVPMVLRHIWQLQTIGGGTRCRCSAHGGRHGE